ncbi:MAG TPA: hypothetical protein VFB72_15370 [Verrucomicrobiae bacterium]|nr:hypothetical protein [Verrucomicrobiae bacterium]
MNDKAINFFGGKRRVVWFSIVLLAIAGGLSSYIMRSRQPMPMYEGKPLTYWLECLAPLNRTETSFQQAEHAIQSIGTNAIPTLLDMLQKSDSPLKVRLMSFLRRHGFLKFKWSLATDQNDEALVAFQMLGPEARGAVPTLVQMYRKNISRKPRSQILDILDSIGPSANEAVPALASFLANTNDELRPLIALTLGQIHSCPEVGVPALTNYLSVAGSDHLVVAMALGNYGKDAKVALPAVEALLTDKEESVRMVSSNVISQIDSQTASRFQSQNMVPQPPR